MIHRVLIGFSRGFRSSFHLDDGSWFGNDFTMVVSSAFLLDDLSFTYLFLKTMAGLMDEDALAAALRRADETGQTASLNGQGDAVEQLHLQHATGKAPTAVVMISSAKYTFVSQLMSLILILVLLIKN